MVKSGKRTVKRGGRTTLLSAVKKAVLPYLLFTAQKTAQKRTMKKRNGKKSMKNKTRRNKKSTRRNRRR